MAFNTKQTGFELPNIKPNTHIVILTQLRYVYFTCQNNTYLVNKF